MTQRDVAVTAVAPVTPIGAGADAFAEAVKDRRSGIDEIVGFDATDFAVQVAGEIQDFDLADYLDSVKSYVDRTSALALAACSMALRDASWEASDEHPIGLVLGSDRGCMDSTELFAEKITTHNPKFAQPFLFTQSYMNAPNSLVAIEFGLRGFNACVSCGRTSGASAIACAFDQVRCGRAERILAGGTEGLSAALCASLDGKSFGPSGEAAAVLALEPATSPDAVCLLGAGQASGSGDVRRAFDIAVADAGIEPGGLDAAVFVGDPAACGRIGLKDTGDGDGATQSISWLDAAMGDTMGAAGAVATSAAVLMLEKDIIRDARSIAVVSADIDECTTVLVLGRPG